MFSHYKKLKNNCFFLNITILGALSAHNWLCKKYLFIWMVLNILLVNWLYSSIHEYEHIWTHLPTLAQVWKCVLLPSAWVYTQGVSQAIYQAIPEDKRLSKPSPIIFLKAEKNPTEIMGMERASIRDSAALIDFLAFLERDVSRYSSFKIILYFFFSSSFFIVLYFSNFVASLKNSTYFLTCVLFICNALKTLLRVRNLNLIGGTYVILSSI